MNKFKLIGALATAGALFPAITSAAAITDLASLLQFVNSVVGVLLPLIIGLAVLVFVFGVFQTISGGDDPEKQKAGRAKIFWGIIAIVVMVSVWGLVNIVTNTIGVSNTVKDAPATPNIDTGGL